MEEAVEGVGVHAGNEAVLKRLKTSKFPRVVILTELAEQLNKGEFDVTLTWVPRGRMSWQRRADQRRFREIQEGEQGGCRRWQSGFQDPSGHGRGGWQFVRGREEARRCGKGRGIPERRWKTKPSERLRDAGSLVTCASSAPMRKSGLDGEV